MTTDTAAIAAGVFEPAQRVRAIGVSEILRITDHANALKRAGRPVIVLGAGEPDFDTPQNVRDAAVRASGPVIHWLVPSAAATRATPCSTAAPP